MAFPYIAIGLFPSLVSFLPKPGPWMETFKHVMAFILLGTVVYLFGILRPEMVGGALAFCLVLGFAAYLWGRYAHGGLGLSSELGLTEAWHALRIVNIADGTNEILNRTIAARMLKGDTEL